MGPASPAVAPPGRPAELAPRTGHAIRLFRRALDSLELLFLVGMGLTSLTILLQLLAQLGRTGGTPTAGPFGVYWFPAVGVGLTVVASVGTALLVIFGIVVGIRGWVRWRWAVRELAEAATEMGPSHAVSVGRAVDDVHRTYGSLGAYVLVWILMAAVVGSTDAALALAGLATIPAAAASVAIGLPGAVVLLAVYYFGSRHLVSAVEELTDEEGRVRLARARSLLLAGAAVGWITVFSAVYWPLAFVGLASLGLLLAGVWEYERTYDGVLFPSTGPRAAHPGRVPVGG
jgi:hypothetical protein